MSSPLAAAIQAGQRSAAAAAPAPPSDPRPGDLPVQPPAVLAAPVEPPMALRLQADPPRPLLRRLGRRALRVLRPLAAPLLHRMDLRIRWAVDHSETAGALRQADSLARASASAQAEDARRAEARLDAVAGAMGHIAAQLDALSSRLDTLSSRLDTFDIKVSATRLDVLAAGRAARADVSAAAQTAANTVSALAAHTAAVGALRQHLHEAGSVWLDQRLAERLEALRQQSAAALQETEQRLSDVGGVWLDQRIAERLAPVQQGAITLQAQSEQLIRSTDRLLQRNVIPVGQDFAVRTDAGYLFTAGEDAGLLMAVIETAGRLEPGTLAVLASLLRAGATMVDVGANIGTMTLPAARWVGAGGKVLALEPAPHNAALLRRTVVLNAVEGWVDVQECAVSDFDGTASFSLSPQVTHGSLVAPDDATQAIDVPVRRLDDLLPPGQRVDVVKIDVEGSELQVWRGMQRVVADNPELAVILEFGPEHLRRAGVTVAAWFAELTSAGHTAWEIDEAAGVVRPLRAAGLGDLFSINILLLRDPPGSRGLDVR